MATVRNSPSEFLTPTFLLPFVGSADPTQTLPRLLRPNSTKFIVTAEDQAHTARSLSTLHKHSLRWSVNRVFPHNSYWWHQPTSWGGEAQPAHCSYSFSRGYKSSAGSRERIHHCQPLSISLCEVSQQGSEQVRTGTVLFWQSCRVFFSLTEVVCVSLWHFPSKQLHQKIPDQL